MIVAILLVWACPASATPLSKTPDIPLLTVLMFIKVNKPNDKLYIWNIYIYVVKFLFWGLTAGWAPEPRDSSDWFTEHQASIHNSDVPRWSSDEILLSYKRACAALCVWKVRDCLLIEGAHCAPFASPRAHRSTSFHSPSRCLLFVWYSCLKVRDTSYSFQHG